MKRLTFVCCLKCSSELYILSGKLLLLPSFMVLCFIFCFGCGFSASVLLSIFIWFLSRIISNEPNNISSSVCCLFLVRDYKELVFFKWLHMVNLCFKYVFWSCRMVSQAYTFQVQPFGANEGASCIALVLLFQIFIHCFSKQPCFPAVFGNLNLLRTLVTCDILET